MLCHRRQLEHSDSDEYLGKIMFLRWLTLENICKIRLNASYSFYLS